MGVLGVKTLQRVLASPSYDPLFEPDYLRASAEGERHQPLCGNHEGWGPLSRTFNTLE